jgi:hypothetical protein
MSAGNHRKALELEKVIDVEGPTGIMERVTRIREMNRSSGCGEHDKTSG